jgi:hypothetical protein
MPDITVPTLCPEITFGGIMKSGGPIVEQATHFCDLMRYFGGEVNPETISALAVPASDKEDEAGYLSAIKAVTKECSLAKSHRVPRFTSAHWFFSSGAVGNLTHLVALHGVKYETTIEVWADGLRMALEEAYFPECKLRVRIGMAYSPMHGRRQLSSNTLYTNVKPPQY